MSSGSFARTFTTRRKGSPASGGRLRRSSAALAVLALAALVSVVAAPGAGANFSTTPKKVLVTIAPSSVPAGNTTTFTASLKNLGSSGDVNSVDITAPAGFLVTGASIGPASNPIFSNPAPTATVVPPRLVQFRNLDIDPGKTRSVTITAIASCTAGAYAWTVAASGYTVDSSSALTGSITGACHLAFATQPANAAENTSITTTNFNSPAGGPILVQVLGTDNTLNTLSTPSITLALTVPNGATLTGGGPVAAIGGIATFSALQVSLPSSTPYTLTATAAGLTSAVSNPFTIVGAVANCAVSCTATATAPAQSTTASAPSTTGLLILSVGVDTLDCGDSALWNHAPSVTTLDQQGVNAIKTATVTIDKSFVNQSIKSRLVLLYRVCYSSPVAFKDFLGRTTNLGLLPRCRSWDDALYPPEYRHTTVPPCVDSIVRDPSGNVVETLKLPASDPKFR